MSARIRNVQCSIFVVEAIVRIFDRFLNEAIVCIFNKDIVLILSIVVVCILIRNFFDRSFLITSFFHCRLVHWSFFVSSLFSDSLVSVGKLLIFDLELAYFITALIFGSSIQLRLIDILVFNLH